MKRYTLAEARQAFLKELQMVADYSEEKRMQATATGLVILFESPEVMKKIREWHAKRRVAKE